MRGTTFLRVVGRLKSGTDRRTRATALPALGQSYRAEFPGKIDSALVTTLKTIPEDVERKFAPRVSDSVRRGGFRVAHRLQ